MVRPRVAIIGLGLIGGSIGLALKQASDDVEIAGHDIDRAVRVKALQRRAVDKAEWNLITTVEGAGLVVLAIPLSEIEETLEAIAPYLEPGTVVTDTATIKEKVLKWAEEILPETVSFIGGNPIVREMSVGLEGARPDLFYGVTYCLVPSSKAQPEAVDFMVRLVRAWGAVPFFIEAPEHDGQMALIEHLPHLLAAGLFRAASRAPGWRDMTRLVSSSFDRATELPAGDAAAYRDICLANRESLVRSVELLVERLNEARDLLLKEDAEGLEELFNDPTTGRRYWMEARPPEEEALREAMEEFRNMGGFRRLVGLRGRPPKAGGRE